MSRRRWKRKLTASWRGRNDKGTEEYNKRFVISVLVGGAYLVSWLAHVWGGQPWPIGSNMVNYAVVLVLFGVSLLLFGNLFARILPQERGFVRACDARLRGSRRGSGPCGICAVSSRLPYLLREHWGVQGICGAFLFAVLPDGAADGAAVLPAYGAVFVEAIYLLLTGKDCPQWMTWGGYGLSAVMYFLGVWIVNTFEGDPYHVRRIWKASTTWLTASPMRS